MWIFALFLLFVGVDAGRSNADSFTIDLEDDMSVQEVKVNLTRAGSPRTCTGVGTSVKTKALLVAFEYGGKIGGALKGTCYDMYNMVRFAKKQGYSDIAYLTDKCIHGEGVIGEDWGAASPRISAKTKVTKAHLTAAFNWLVEDSCPGDTLLFHYSGHGNFVTYEGPDKQAGKDECNGKDEALVLPMVYDKKWTRQKYYANVYYTDDEIFNNLVAKVPASVHLFAIVDACHSGTVFDLPWNWMSQKYYWSCPAQPDQRAYTKSQFVWEWAKPPEALGRPYPLQGTVTLITGSQNSQTSGDAGMGRVTDPEGNVHNVGGLMTYRLILHHPDTEDSQKLNPPILETAMQEKWSWAQTISEIVKQVAGKEELVSSQTKQIPNFGASHRLNMDATFALDGSAFATPPASSDPESASKLKCDDGAWMRSKQNLKNQGCK